MSATTRAATTVPAAVIERLKAVVGPAGYLDDPADIAPYCKSWRDDWVGDVPLVLRPQSTAEVAEIVRICAEARVAIVPQGGNTGLTGGSQPHGDKSEVIVSTSRMKRIRALDTTDDTITVEAGVVLKEIQNAADDADRLFPLSLGAEGSCQIGGNISTNAGGVQVLRYGNTRNLVLGLEVVLPDGQIWNGLRSLRKDNTGYDMKQLFIGAEGTLGIITAAVLRLFPKPTASETAWIARRQSRGRRQAALAHARAAGRRRLGLRADLPRASSISCSPACRDTRTRCASVHPWYVLMDVTSQGPAGSLHEPLERGARRRARSRPHSRRADRSLGRAGGQALEDARKPGRGAGVRRRHASRTTCRCRSRASPSSSRAPMPRWRAPTPASGFAPSVTSATATCTTIRLARSTGPASATCRSARRINRIVHDIVVELGGSISAEHGIGRSRLAELEHYKAPVEIGMMRAVKRALDPHNIMNPHKVVPG